MTTPTRRVQLPAPPTVRHRPALPWSVSVVPVVLAVVALVGAGPEAAACVLAVVPLVWVLRVGGDRLFAGRLSRRETARFEHEWATAEMALRACQAAERRELLAAFPSSSEVAAGARGARSDVLVLGRGRVASSVVVEGDTPSASEDPGLRDRVAALRLTARTLDGGPMCIPIETPVLVVGPGAVAESVAAGLRRQVVASGAGTRAGGVSVAATSPADPPRRGVVVTLRPDGSAAVTRCDGVHCDVPVAVSYVRVAVPGAGRPPAPPP